MRHATPALLCIARRARSVSSCRAAGNCADPSSLLSIHPGSMTLPEHVSN